MHERPRYFVLSSFRLALIQKFSEKFSLNINELKKYSAFCVCGTFLEIREVLFVKTSNFSNPMKGK